MCLLNILRPTLLAVCFLGLFLELEAGCRTLLRNADRIPPECMAPPVGGEHSHSNRHENLNCHTFTYYCNCVCVLIFTRIFNGNVCSSRSPRWHTSVNRSTLPELFLLSIRLISKSKSLLSFKM